MSASKKKSKSKPKKESYKKYFIHYTYCLAIIALLSITTLNINKYLDSQKVLGTSIDVTPLQNERLYWQTLVSQNPTYIDGYLELAKVNVELSNKVEAEIYINKALSLDPNSLKIIEVKNKLGL
ncbi:hypothetical protein BH10PAT1_BH10PAT1_7850 [soil metagenome]